MRSTGGATTIFGLALGLLAASACGGGGSPDRQEYVDAAIASVEAAEEDENFEFSRRDTECIAEAIVDTVGAERLDDAGVSPAEFSTANDLSDLDVEVDRDDLADGINDCDVDLGEVFVDALAQSLGPVELSEESLSCITERVGDTGAIGDAMAGALLGADESEAVEIGEAAGFEAFGQCPQAMTELIVQSIEAQGLDLSAEAEACIAGEITARGEEVGTLLAAAADDPAAAEEMGVSLVTPCQHLLG